MRFIQMFTGITVSFVLAACTAVQGYEGAALSNSETALITAKSDQGLRISVGVPAPGTGTTHNLRILPGYSCVNVEARRMGRPAPTAPGGGANLASGSLEQFELCFEANAGRTYEVKVLQQIRGREGSIVAARIEDAETGEVLDAKEVI